MYIIVKLSGGLEEGFWELQGEAEEEKYGVETRWKVLEMERSQASSHIIFTVNSNERENGI